MKILYVHQYFKTPEQGGGIRSWHIAKYMVQSGHEVVMLTSHNELNIKVAEIEGFKVVYLPVFYINHLSFIARIWAFLKFMFKAINYSLKEDFDLMYVTSTPLSVGFIALINKWFRGKKYVFEVRDIWPDVPIEMGILKNKLLIYLLKHFEYAVYKRADSIVSLSPGISKRIKSNDFNVSIIEVPNFSDTELFTTNNNYIEGEKIVVSYIGTIGKANGLESMLILAEAAQMNFKDKFEFNIMGEGAELEKIKSLALFKQLRNVFFMNHSHKFDVINLMNKSNVLYVSFAQFSILGETTSPNKFFDAIAMKKLVVVNFEGWLKDLLLEFKAGYYFNNSLEGAIDILEKLLCFHRDAKLRKVQELGVLAMLESKFEKNILLEKLMKSILQ